MTSVLPDVLFRCSLIDVSGLQRLQEAPIHCWQRPREGDLLTHSFIGEETAARKGRIKGQKAEEERREMRGALGSCGLFSCVI